MCYIDKKEGDFMSILGERIRTRRIELNMTQEELCKKVGYKSRTTVNKVELGCNAINQKRIIAFAKALQTTPAYLMGWEEPTKEENHLITLIEQLTDEEVEELSNFVDYIISKRKKP